MHNILPNFIIFHREVFTFEDNVRTKIWWTGCWRKSFSPEYVIQLLKESEGKVKFSDNWNIAFMIIMFTKVLLFRYKEKGVDGFVWDTCAEIFFVCLHFQVSAMNRLQVFSYRLEFSRLNKPSSLSCSS